MRIVKSLLLGSAAGLVAVAGAQAADMPVKAKPVEYVKICNLYGDGFFYIPGTDTCLRVGGAMMADHYYNALGNGHIHYDVGNGAQDRSVSAWSQGKARVDLALDARTQTSYGTVRAFVQFRIDNTDGNTNTLNEPRGFIQWAGFTFGHTRSYSDPYATWGGGDGFGSFLQGQTHPDSGANGTNQISYTWELGNGAVLVLGADERRNNSLANLSTAGTVAVGAAPTSSRAGMNFPDPYVAFRMSQAWGNFSAAIHASNNNALYYTAVTPGFAACLGTAGGPTPAIPAGPQAGGTTLCGHPEDKMGFAALFGLQINLPMIAPGDRVGAFAAVGQGASKYAGGQNIAGVGLFGGGNNVAMGWVTDGVYLNGTGIQLTSSWAAGIAYEHWWTPQLKSSVYASHSENKYNNTVVAGGWFCGRGGAGAQSIAQVDPTRICDPSYNYSDVRANISWYPVPGFRLGAEVGYIMVGGGLDGQQITLTKTQGLRPTGVYTARDQNIVAVALRANRGFGGVGE